MSHHLRGCRDKEEEDHAWKNNRIFTGNQPSYPVELFIYLMEEEGKYLQHDEPRIASNAWCLIDSPSGDCKTPAGVWKVKMASKHGQEMLWPVLKTELLNSFARNDPFTCQDLLDFLQSLTKGEAESYRTYLFRIQWVLQLIQSTQTWTKLLFLLGLEKSSQSHLSHYLNEKTADELCQVIDGTTDGCKLIKEEVSQDMESKDFHEDMAEDISEFLTANRSEYALKHPCSQCKQMFKSKKAMQAHQKTHRAKQIETKKRRRFYCGKCNQDHTNQEEWDQHEAKFHLGACNLCSAEIDDLSSMRDHHAKEHGGHQIKCLKCNGVATYNSISEHQCKTESNPALIKRKKSFEAQKHLRTYFLKENESPEGVRCMTTHLVGTKNGKTVWYCGYCSEEFAKRNALVSHTKHVHKRLKFRCDVCFQFQAYNLTKVALHKAQVHDQSTENFPILRCEEEKCGFKTVMESAFALHRKYYHSDNKSTICGVCEKRFYSPSHLKAHVETVHMKMKRYQCKDCNDCFSRPDQLRDHMEELHGPDGPQPKKDKRVMCPHCGLKYRDDTGLRKHIKRIHDGGTEVSCPTCNKTLKNKIVLKQHILVVHEKSQKYACSQCSRICASSYNLRLHIKKSHMNFKPYKCGICEKPYSNAKDCAVHIGQKHENWSAEEANAKYKYVAKNHPGYIKFKVGELDLDDVKINP